MGVKRGKKWKREERGQAVAEKMGKSKVRLVRKNKALKSEICLKDS